MWCDHYEKGNIDTELYQMIKYNRKDSELVYAIAEKFFKWTFSTPFGHSFLPNMIYHSLSSLAWSMWERCFFKDIMFVNKNTLPIELSMKIGGLTQTYRRKAGCGIIIDVNSFYPAIMKNMMPLHYKDYGEGSVKEFKREITVDNIGIIETCSMYMIKFCFPSTCMLPTIVEKTGDTLIMPLRSQMWRDSAEEDKEDGCVWVYGETIKVAVMYGEARIRCFKIIEMIPGHVHKDFVDYCYKKRLEAKSKGDTIQDKFFKNMMNSCFGKHG